MTYENPLPGNQLVKLEWDPTYEGGTTRREPWYPGYEGEPNAVTSEVTVKEGWCTRVKNTSDTGTDSIFRAEPIHRPVLDIDFPAKLVPSSTPDHFHLYLDHEIPWSKYVNLLKALADAGIIEQGYASASIARGYTCLRLPGVSKDVGEY